MILFGDDYTQKISDRKAHSYFDNAQLRCVFGFGENDSLVSYGVSNPG